MRVKERLSPSLGFSPPTPWQCRSVSISSLLVLEAPNQCVRPTSEQYHARSKKIWNHAPTSPSPIPSVQPSSYFLGSGVRSSRSPARHLYHNLHNLIGLAPVIAIRAETKIAEGEGVLSDLTEDPFLATGGPDNGQGPRFFVRRATKADIDAIADIRTSSFVIVEDEYAQSEYFLRQRKEEFLDAVESRLKSPQIFILVAVDTRPQESPATFAGGMDSGEVLVGTADVELMPRRKPIFWDPESLPFRGYVSNMSVLEPYRRLGVGRTLLKGCECLALDKGTHHMYLHVMEDNLAAQIAYERSGYSVDKIEGGMFLPGRPRRIRMYKRASGSPST